MAPAGSLALGHDALLPRPPGGLASGAALALAVHVALILALTTAVDWRTRPPEVFSAELWASVPQTAAPAAVVAPAPATPVPLPAPPPAPAPEPTPAPAPAPKAVPPPPPRIAEPDIATQRAARIKAEEKREQAEATRKKAEAERLKEEQAERDKDARQAQAEDARLAKLREANLKRMMGQADSATGRIGSAAQDAGPSSTYAAAVAARIRRELVFPGNVPDSAEAEVLVRAAANGTIIARQLTKTSGYKDWDEAVLRAIDKTGTLPRDVDGRVQPVLTLVFRRKE